METVVNSNGFSKTVEAEKKDFCVLINKINHSNIRCNTIYRNISKSFKWNSN